MEGEKTTVTINIYDQGKKGVVCSSPDVLTPEQWDNVREFAHRMEMLQTGMNLSKEKT